LSAPRGEAALPPSVATRLLGSTTVTSTMLGALRADGRSRAEFFTLAGSPKFLARAAPRAGVPISLG